MVERLSDPIHTIIIDCSTLKMEPPFRARTLSGLLETFPAASYRKCCFYEKKLQFMEQESYFFKFIYSTVYSVSSWEKIRMGIV